METYPVKPAEAPESDAPVTPSAPAEPPAWYRRRPFVVAGALLALFLLTGLVLCLLFSRTPRLQDVERLARERATSLGHRKPEQRLPTGYITAHTVLLMAETLLQKPGGYLSNDRLSPAMVLDNITNWEYGALLQIREMFHAMRQEFSRSRAQSAERAELVEAEARFNFNHRSWVLPSSESQYEEGIAFLNQYLGALATSAGEAELFVSRVDVLDAFLLRQQRRLGSFSVRLRASVAIYEYNPYILTSHDVAQMEADGIEVMPQQVTPWTERDDVFYEVRGSVYVLYHTMLAVQKDFEDVLNNVKGMGTMNRILSELHSACQPMRSPMVLNGREFGILHNHSLTEAAHLVKAHLAIQDLRILLRGGSDV